MQLAYGAVYDQTLYEAMEDLDLLDNNSDFILISEETELEKKQKKQQEIEKRRARISQLEKEGRVMTSQRRTSEAAKSKRAEKKADRLEKAGENVLRQIQGTSGRVSTRPMGTEAPKAKSATPEATRTLHRNLKRDTLGTAADKIIKQLHNTDDVYKKGAELLKKIQSEDYAYYEIVASYLLENNFAETISDVNVIIENMSENWIMEILEGYKDLPVSKMIKQAKRTGKDLSNVLGVKKSHNELIVKGRETGNKSKTRLGYTRSNKVSEVEKTRKQRPGYGGVSSFSQDTDVDNFRPGRDVPASRQYSRFMTFQGKKKPVSKEIVRKSKSTNEEFELWVSELLDEGYDLSEYTWDELYEGYLDLLENL